MLVWHGGGMSDCDRDCRFESQPCLVMSPLCTSCSYTYASITKQYNVVLAKAVILCSW